MEPTMALLTQPTFENIKFDFEEYVMSQGIPETRDPLPYRKPKSIFGAGTGATEHNVITSAKHHPRLRTVVCRHWLRGLCMKGPACEFLHRYDVTRMPICDRGDRCRVKGCPFRHVNNRSECVFYSQGFCVHGAHCRHEHVKKERQDLPIVADFTKGLTHHNPAAMDTASKGSGGSNQHQHSLFKTSLCNHFSQTGKCPFGSNCHFAHGEAELRRLGSSKKRRNNEGKDDQNARKRRAQTSAEPESNRISSPPYKY